MSRRPMWTPSKNGNLKNPKHERSYSLWFKSIAIAGVYWLRHWAERKIGRARMSARDEIMLAAMNRAVEKHWKGKGIASYIMNEKIYAELLVLSADNAYKTVYYDALDNYIEELARAKLGIFKNKHITRDKKCN